MRATFAGLTAARKRLAELAKGLHAIASGEVVARTVAKVQAQIEEVARKKLAGHVATGAALASLVVRADGSLVLLSANRYLRYHGFWPFRRGMPGFVVKSAAQTFAAEVLAALGGRSGTLGALAESIADEQAAGDAKKREAADRREEARYERATKRREEKADRDTVSAAKRARRTVQRKAASETRRAARREERATIRSRAQFKRDTARIARQSAEGKAARRAQAAKRRAAKKAAAS